jgi:hypothetical protein
VPPELPPHSPNPLEPLAADAVVAQGGDSSHPHAHSAGNSHCLNCGSKLQGPFCSACGQHDFDFHRSFGHVFLEALESIFHFDGKFFRNIATLVCRPGQLTAAFNAGKRASQVPPFRLYIFTAFIFFLLVLATNENRATRAGLVGEPRQLLGAQLTKAGESDASAASVAEDLKGSIEQFRAEQLKRHQAKDADAAGAAKPAEGEFVLWLQGQGQRSMDPQFQREIGQRFLVAMPKMFLLCLPLFALLTRVLFRKSGQVYLQHLVLALHYHTFLYIFLMMRDGWAFIGEVTHLSLLSGSVHFIAKIWLVLYPVLMLRRLFGNSWPKTIVKTGLLAFSYCFVLALAFTVTAAVLFLMS